MNIYTGKSIDMCLIDDFEPATESLLDGDFSCETTEIEDNN